MSEMLFSKEHCWVKTDGDKATVGITDFALKITGKIYFINLCDEDEYIECGELMGDIEAKKTVFDLICPLSGTVISVNDMLLQKPTMLNVKPFENGLVTFVDFELPDELMTEEQYKEYSSTVKIKRRGAEV